MTLFPKTSHMSDLLWQVRHVLDLHLYCLLMVRVSKVLSHSAIVAVVVDLVLYIEISTVPYFSEISDGVRSTPKWAKSGTFSNRISVHLDLGLNS